MEAKKAEIVHHITEMCMDKMLSVCYIIITERISKEDLYEVFSNRFK